jgi:hypothetical protein
MNEKDRLQKLIDWVRAKNDRHVNIEIGRPNNKNFLQIWVSDYSINIGKFIDIESIKSIDKLDLRKEAEEAQREQYEKLKAIYEHEPKEATN